MSHFVVIITNTQEKDIERQLAPFDEDREVPTYDRNCFCIGTVASRDARDKADTKLNTSIDDIRKAYWELPETEQSDEKWDEMTKELFETRESIKKKHPLYQKPDPDCNECHGVGTYKSQYNPNSKWDWYETGGRWTGYFKLKDGAEGKLGRPGVFDNKAKVNSADIARVKDIDFEKMGDEIVPFAILHEGEWQEKGSMGWFGMVSDEKDRDEWNAYVRKFLVELDPEIELSAVDCHI